ncbi:MAG TPA: DMT family transporter [Propionibacteriaceae bacterium]|nr:DMT family transporter [Propionibacteriaceae bacterium]
MSSTVGEIRQTKTTRGGSSWRTLLAVGITVVAWASAFVVIRYAAHDIRPGALSLGRLLVASLALSVMMIGRKLVRMNAREWWLTAVVGVAWFAIYSLALNAGEQHVDAGTAAMLIQFAPILIGVLAGILLGEGFPRMLVIGGLVAFVGTLIIGIATSTGRADLIGVLLVLLSATTYSIALVAQKVVLRRVSALQVTWLACLIGTIACLPFAGQLVHDMAAAPPLQIIGVVYLGLVPSALAFSTWAYALKHTTAGKLGVTTFVVPPMTILMGWLFLGEVPPLLAIVGGALSLVGVAIASRPSKPRVTVPSGM